MRVIYDTATGRVAALGDAVEAGEGQAATELTPQESAALADAAATVEDLTARLRNAVAEQQAARGRYDRAAAARRQAFALAEAAAREDGGAVGFDPRIGFVTIAAAPGPEPTPEEDEVLVMADPRMAALLRVLQRQATQKE